MFKGKINFQTFILIRKKIMTLWEIFTAKSNFNQTNNY